MHTITLQTSLSVGFFALGYMLFTIRKAARRQLDLYDLIMLSMVAVVPSAFVFFPELAYIVAEITGVEFPFVAMFGMLFAILFVFVHRIIIKLHRLEADNHLLLQEVSLLRQASEAKQRVTGLS